MTNHTSRREFLDFSVSGLGAAALLSLFGADLAPASERRATFPGTAPGVKRAIQICLIGGLSHVDSFDYKPQLNRFDGKQMPDTVQPNAFNKREGLMRSSEWTFRQHGESGLWISDLFPHLASVADELTLINSMFSESANHTPAMFLQNSGFASNGFPSLGSWLSYGLGNETESLPTFVALPDARSLPNSGAANWTSGFLPAQHQGTLFQSGENPVRNLFAPTKIAPQIQRKARDLLHEMNHAHWQRRGDDLLKARMRAYELAARMQASVPEFVDFADESAAIQSHYGLGQKATADCGRRCLLARRLLERGVRFVRIFSTASEPICVHFGGIFDGVGERWELKIAADSVLEVLISADAQLFGRLHDGGEDVHRPRTSNAFAM